MSDLQVCQTAYNRDRGQAESEPDPDRDIELELCALDLEDSDPQDIKSPVGMMMKSHQSDGAYTVKTHVEQKHIISEGIF